jgi:HlyD family secretion protein
MSDALNPAEAQGAAARELERELAAQGGRRWLRRLLTLAVVVALVAGFVLWRRATRPPPPPRFTGEKVEQRDIKEEVQSTGTVKPLTEVQVGAQVSGRIVKVHVDFNSRVKRGDLLAEIDQKLLGAQVDQTGAQLRSAQAALKRAEASLRASTANVGRLEKLAADGLASQAEIDQARGTRDVAMADVAAAKAQISQTRAVLGSARTNYDLARIYSPIDGIVVSRAVEPGQTVAASFATPTLFVIAQDLSKMQVFAEIDEADIGRVAEGLRADVVVDAFPGKKFEGKVTQLRFSPNTVQGVVTYSAVISVDNPALELRPGMTATITVRAREVKGVRAVRNASLRFRPLPEKDQDGKPLPQKPLDPLPPGKGRVFLVDSGGKPGAETVSERVVDVGITDGVWTELKGTTLDLATVVVTEQREDDKKKRFGF